MQDEQKLFISKIEDLITSVNKGRYCAFSRFLSLEEQLIAKSYAEKFGINCKVYGGYEDFERGILCFFNGDEPKKNMFPIDALFFSHGMIESINHRDVLGALMSLGIKRETVGDIIFCDGKCIFFVDPKMTDYIRQNLLSVKKCNVDIEIHSGEVEYDKKFIEMSCTVSSMRLDCVVSEIASKSRSTASDMIEGGLIFVNGVQCQKKDRIIQICDVISVRKIGKFKISECVGKTKKDRLKLIILKYN